MAGAVFGARHGVEGFPPDAVAFLEAANPGFDLRRVASELMEIRR